ncbi:MAG: DNA polymerase III subunit delta' [Clostridia bacterium]|nr:DNA polymerase III subunit delta' [Clostridia bacterium]
MANLSSPVALSDFTEQGPVYQSLQRDLSLGQGVHAYLFTGPKGVGKRTLAALVGQGILCSGPSKPCGQCPACKRVMDGNHPDVTILSDDKSIKVDAVRDMLRQVSEHTYEGGKRIVMIHSAEKMTQQAQNSLLKTLEEPNDETVFLLTCDDATQLLPTIVSRCRVLKMHPWSEAYVQKVLLERGLSADRARLAAHISAGSIGAALASATDESYWTLRTQLFQTVFSMEHPGDAALVSGRFKDAKDTANQWLNTVEEMIREVMLVRLGQADAAALADHPAPWQKASQEAPLDFFERLLEAVFNARRLKANQVNWQAAMETLLLVITEEMKPWQL